MSENSLILASGSFTRAQLLKNSGVEFRQVPANIDESEIKDSLRFDECPTNSAAEILAELKAKSVSKEFPDALVLGLDTMLEVDLIWLSKPQTKAEVKTHLQRLRAKTHLLVTSVVAVNNGQRLWHHTETAKLTTRNISDAFITSYIDKTGDTVLSSVGAYHLEGLGAQLFSKVEGNYFAILGLPLIPILMFLRNQGFLKN